MANIEAVSNEFCQVFAGIKFEFSLLHCTSPTVNDIATSKVAATFTGRLKRDNKSWLLKSNFFKHFNNDNDNFSRLKGC